MIILNCWLLKENRIGNNNSYLQKGASNYANVKRKIDSSMFAPCGMNCKVCYKDCIMEKALSYCFECSKYPCELIKNLEKSYNKRYQASLIENGRFAQKSGLDYFIEQQKEKYFSRFV